MKKVLAVTMVCLLAFMLAACGGIPQEKKDTVAEKLSNLESIYEQAVASVDAARSAGAELPSTVDEGLDMIKEALAPVREVVDNDFAGVNEEAVDQLITDLDTVTPMLESVETVMADLENQMAANEAAGAVLVQLQEKATEMNEKLTILGETMADAMNAGTLPEGMQEEFLLMADEIATLGQDMVNSDGSVEQQEDFILQMGDFIARIDAMQAEVDAL